MGCRKRSGVLYDVGAGVKVRLCKTHRSEVPELKPHGPPEAALEVVTGKERVG